MGGRILASPIEMTSHPYNSAALPHSLSTTQPVIIKIGQHLT